jgi:acetolactate synthase I/II/III large subunit
MKGSEATVRMLIQAGVKVIFGLCGDTSLPFYDALHGVEGDLRHVLTRDERSASFMADAYARFSGRVGVCEGPSGGGVTYIAPGVIEANLSSVPLVAITTDIDVRTRDRGTLTEMDQDAFFSPLTKWTHTPAHGHRLPWTIRQAFREATAGALGATHIGLPHNVQEDDVADSDVHIDPAYGRYPVRRNAPDPQELKQAARLLVESRCPILVGGAGVIRSQAWTELTALAELLGCPVATSISGKGAIAEIHPLSLGVIGSNGGLAYRHEMIREADLMLYVGCRAGSVTTEKWTLPRAGELKVLQMDVEPARLGLNYPVEAALACDARLGLVHLTEAVSDLLAGHPSGKVDPESIRRRRETFLAERREFASDERPIRPERFVAEFSEALPAGSLVVADPGTPTPYLAAYWRVPKAGRWFIAPRAHGALGYSIPAVVGAHFARPAARVVGVMGDGSFGMAVGELETIARLGVPATLIVLRNSTFGWVKAGQRVMGERYFGVDFSTSDHVRIAEAFGLPAWRVEDPADLGPRLRLALREPGPNLVEVVVQPLHEASAPVSKWIA